MQSVEIGNTWDLIGEYIPQILHSYERYVVIAPSLAHFDGVPMRDDAKSRMLQVFRRTNGGSLLHLREALKRQCRRCPFCNISTASDLDHFLPKDSFPCLAILSWNLIPICPECNRLKARGANGAFIHSYYDQFPDEPFLRANVAFEPGLVIINFSLDLTHIAVELGERIRNHFEVLDLANRYALEAQERISAFRLSLPSVLDNGGPDAVRSELERRRTEASLYGRNYWERALLTALISSRFYCEGGFVGG
jgi:5-methylcytosine-specific restriction endonuclease McrA